MTDLTVLVSPIPLYPGPESSAAQRFNPFSSLRATRSRGHIKPVMVTLESEREEVHDYDHDQLQGQEERRGRELHRPGSEEAGGNSHSMSIRSDPAGLDPNPDSAGSESDSQSPVDLPSSSASPSTPGPSPSPSPSSSLASPFAPPYTSSTPLPASAIAAPRSRSRRPQSSREPSNSNSNSNPNPNTRPPTDLDPNLLSPPVNTWKSRPPPSISRPRHRPTRSQSAPPERRFSGSPNLVAGGAGATDAASPTLQYFGSTTALSSATTSSNSAAFGYNQPPLLLGGYQKRSFGAFNTHTSNRQTIQGGELVRPPPPLLRPTTFWRKTRRSGVTGASYSPSSHLIRRATYVAAGLPFDAPAHDLSALCVESRVGFIVVPPVEGVL